ncbi:hypothetical protein [Cryptosporangium sp. NPDC048952]|uniref:hypothetical protein n=1 Tax=Cryptosporangium sp. NPDC048952 TaxID=3363961 RepID=UPI003713B094
MARAWAVGATASLFAFLLYESARGWASMMGPHLLTPLFLLLSFVGIGTATGHAAVSLTGKPQRAWPAVVVVAVVGAVLIGWGRDAELLRPALGAFPAALGGGACTAVGGWLGLVLPNVHRAAAPVSVLTSLKTVELRVRRASSAAPTGGRHHKQPAPESAEPDILEFGR